jgi:hypothetical protein
MKRPYQIESQRAVKRLEEMAEGQVSVQMMLPEAMHGWIVISGAVIINASAIVIASSELCCIRIRCPGLCRRAEELVCIRRLSAPARIRQGYGRPQHVYQQAYRTTRVGPLEYLSFGITSTAITYNYSVSVRLPMNHGCGSYGNGATPSTSALGCERAQSDNS